MQETSEIIMRYCKDDLMSIRAMWDEIFADPKPFADYYFDTVCAKKSPNRVLVAYVNDDIVGMIHLNPYTVNINDKKKLVYYIVGVSVKQDMRRQGIMKKMLNKVLDDLKNEGCIFAFLMPEKQEYYLGFGFEMIYENSIYEYHLKTDAGIYIDKQENIYCNTLNEYKDEALSELARKWNGSLVERYKVFSIRDIKYLRSMYLEHICQNGDVCAVYDSAEQNNFLGIFAYGINESTMYVERFYSVNENARDIINILLRKAIEYDCSKCVVTIPEANIGKDDYKFEGIELNVSSGKGIMAKTLNDIGDFDIEAMKGNSFFDEIV